MEQDNIMEQDNVMEQTIMILGGYGQVGTYITKQLASKNKDRLHIIIAGRSIEKGKQLADQYPDCCNARAMDVTRIEKENLNGIDTVIMCFETNNYEVLQQCIGQKVNYIDITPSNSIIEQLLTLQEEAVHAGIKVILGVGIAPGVSNLLAVRAAKELERVDEIKSYLMLGVGEDHGRDAVKWLVNQLTGTYPVQTKGVDQMTRSFTQTSKLMMKSAIRKSKRKSALKSEGRKRVHDFTRIDLADQYINRRLYPQAVSNSWFAYDVNYVTKMMRGMNSLHLFTLCRYPKINRLYQKMFRGSMGLAKKLSIGTDQYASIVYVTGCRNGRKQTIKASVTGKNNSRLTGSVAAALAVNINQAHVGIQYACEAATIDQLGIPYSCEKTATV